MAVSLLLFIYLFSGCHYDITKGLVFCIHCAREVKPNLTCHSYRTTRYQGLLPGGVIDDRNIPIFVVRSFVTTYLRNY